MDQGGLIEFAQDEPRHYDRFPAIADHITYIEESTCEETGEKIFTRKRLTPTQKEIYRIIRYRAGTTACWRNTDDIADHVGCSKTSVIDAKRIFCMPFEQLEGNPLIQIETRMVSVKRGDKVISKCPKHVIKVTPIWSYNNAFIDAVTAQEKKISEQKKINEDRMKFQIDPIPVDDRIPFPRRKQTLSSQEAERAIDRLGQPGPVTLVNESRVHKNGAQSKNGTSLVAQSKNGTSSPEGSVQNWTENKYLLNKDPCLRTDTAAQAGAHAASRCFLFNSSVEDCFGSIASAFSALMQFGYSEKKASHLVKEYSLDELCAAWVYVRCALKKNGKEKASPTGYFLTALEKKWYTHKAR
jgi:hypothetical protein